MAAGVPIILMNQNTEKYIVENNRSGFLIQHPDEYCAVVKLLYQEQQERNRIAQNARERIKTDYSIKDNTKRLYSCYEKVMRYDKRHINFRDIFGINPSDWFLYFVESERTMFNNNRFDSLPEIFKGESKSSIKHFAKYFPKDKKLAAWIRQLKKL
jgi:hypothetical protein